MASFRDVLFKKALKTRAIAQNNNFVVKFQLRKHLDTLVIMFIEPGRPTPLGNTQTYILVPIRTASHDNISYYRIITLITLIDTLFRQAGSAA
jgi:hypothetical protein